MAPERLTQLLMSIAPLSSESGTADNRVMTVIVELALTYLIHSTLFMGTAWLLLIIVTRFRRRQRGLSPANEERLWKFVTVLAFVTVPVSQYSGWSWSIWQQPYAMRGSQAEDLPERSDAMPFQSPEDFRWSDDSHPVTSMQDNSTTNSGAVVVPLDPRTLIESLADDALLGDTKTPFQDGEFPATSLETSTVDSVARPIHGWISDSSGTAGHSSNVKSAIASILSTDFDHGSASRSMFVVCVGTIIILSISIGATRLVSNAIRLNRFLRSCSPAMPSLRKSLPRMGPFTTGIRLLTAGYIDSGVKPSGRDSVVEPFACGIRNWTIVLPESIEHELSSDELQALLAHETAHLVRRDPLWQWVNEVLCVCLPFQPLHFLLRRRWRQVAELLCDDWVVEQQISALALARCLTQIAELRLGQRPVFGMSAVDRSSRFTSRIEWLLRDRHVKTPIGSRGPAVIALIAFLLGVAVGVYGPRITLSPAAIGGNESASEVDWSELESEMKSTLNDLGHLDHQLSNILDPEIRAAAIQLRERTERLRSRWNELR